MNNQLNEQTKTKTKNFNPNSMNDLHASAHFTAHPTSESRTFERTNSTQIESTQTPSQSNFSPIDPFSLQLSTKSSIASESTTGKKKPGKNRKNKSKRNAKDKEARDDVSVRKDSGHSQKEKTDASSNQDGHVVPRRLKETTQSHQLGFDNNHQSARGSQSMTSMPGSIYSEIFKMTFSRGLNTHSHLLLKTRMNTSSNISSPAGSHSHSDHADTTQLAQKQEKTDATQSQSTASGASFRLTQQLRARHQMTFLSQFAGAAAMSLSSDVVPSSQNLSGVSDTTLTSTQEKGQRKRKIKQVKSQGILLSTEERQRSGKKQTSELHTTSTHSNQSSEMVVNPSTCLPEEITPRSTSKQQPHHGSGTNHSSEGIKLLDLTIFKTQPCKVLLAHNPKKCFYFHEANKKDRRRYLGTYTSEMCFEAANCPNRDACIRAHNRVEDFYHPEKYKAKFCSSFPDRVESCDYGEMCAFAHAEDELSVDLLHKMEHDNDFYMFHFKTVWCPFSDKEHQRDVCIYAHNWQDFRRKPHQYSYTKEQCQHWETKKNTKTYKDGCRLEYRCGSCHGWKEQEYHPFNYKTSECRVPQGGKCKKKHCPYYHNDSERRSSINHNYKLFPRNRGNTVSQVGLYSELYLEVMFQEAARTQQIMFLQKQGAGKSNQYHQQNRYGGPSGNDTQQFVAQDIYGCGPQSVPILDPHLVLSYQKALFKAQPELFSKTLGLVPQIIHPEMNDDVLPFQKSDQSHHQPQPQHSQYYNQNQASPQGPLPQQQTPLSTGQNYQQMSADNPQQQVRGGMQYQPDHSHSHQQQQQLAHSSLQTRDFTPYSSSKHQVQGNNQRGVANVASQNFNRLPMSQSLPTFQNTSAQIHHSQQDTHYGGGGPYLEQNYNMPSHGQFTQQQNQEHLHDTMNHNSYDKEPVQVSSHYGGGGGGASYQQQQPQRSFNQQQQTGSGRTAGGAYRQPEPSQFNQFNNQGGPNFQHQQFQPSDLHQQQQQQTQARQVTNTGSSQQPLNPPHQNSQYGIPYNHSMPTLIDQSRKVAIANFPEPVYPDQDVGGARGVPGAGQGMLPPSKLSASGQVNQGRAADPSLDPSLNPLLSNAQSQLNQAEEAGQIYKARQNTLPANGSQRQSNNPSWQKPNKPFGQKTFGHSMQNISGAENRGSHVWGSSAMSDHLHLPIDGGETYMQFNNIKASSSFVPTQGVHQPGDNLLDNFSSSVFNDEEDSGNEEDMFVIRKMAERNQTASSKEELQGFFVRHNLPEFLPILHVLQQHSSALPIRSVSDLANLKPEHIRKFFRKSDLLAEDPQLSMPSEEAISKLLVALEKL